MRWRTGRRSANVEDRRGRGGFGRLGGGLGGGIPGGFRRGGARGAGIGGLGLVIVVVVALLFGVDPSMLLQGGPSGFDQATVQQPGAPDGGASDEMKDFVSVVLADTEDTWHELFAKSGGTYEEPSLVLFSGAVQSGCGFASAQVGPFYCPADRKVYLDLEFFDEMAQRFGAPGDFAQAYVIAHEVGHHVQTLLGISGKVQQLRSQLSEAEANALSVRLELQADCFAGLWANHANRSRQILEAGDVEEALGAATAIGDDRLQRQTQGYVVPDSFTHGTSEQRVRWFGAGLESGSIQACDSFNADQL
ncbi:MAG: neutral zinc metallopeptidase [Alphaproteobacteria bacterium]|nr:MAG: neutral zinc metallopeptidase [Alphaproteobacteria bacterium]